MPIRLPTRRCNTGVEGTGPGAPGAIEPDARGGVVIGGGSERRAASPAGTVRIAVRDAPPGLLDHGIDLALGVARRWALSDPGSELSLLNLAGGSRVVVPDDTFRLLTRTRWAWRATHGRFDPGLGPTGGTPPVIRLDPAGRAVRLAPGVRLDPGPLGPASITDDVAVALARAGAGAVWVQVGTHRRAVGAGLAQAPWPAPGADPASRAPAASWTEHPVVGFGPVALGPAAWLAASCVAVLEGSRPSTPVGRPRPGWQPPGVVVHLPGGPGPSD